MLRVKIAFRSCLYSHHYAEITARMRAEGYAQEARQRFIELDHLQVAEVEIRVDGSIQVVSIRTAERCAAVHETGLRCSHPELHGNDHEAVGADGLLYRWRSTQAEQQAEIFDVNRS